MELAMVGLGRRGLNMCKRLLGESHTVHALARSVSWIAEAVAAGAVGVSRFEDLAKLPPPRIVWVRVPAGKTTADVIEQLAGLLARGDIIIDGGNSYYKDSIEHHKSLQARGIRFLDAGTSGGMWVLQFGYCLIVGGDKGVCTRGETIFRSLAPNDAYALGRGPGAGLFSKLG